MSLTLGTPSSLIEFYDLDIEVASDATRFRTAKARHLWEWWRAAAARAGGVPPRRAFDIVDHRPIVAHVFLAERLEDGDFTYRIVGEEVVRMMGRNAARERVLRDSPPGYGQALRDHYAGVVEAGACRRTIGMLAFEDRPHRRFESLDCPFTNDDGTVGTIIGVIDYAR